MYKVLAIFFSLVAMSAELLALEVAPFVYAFDPDLKEEMAFQYYITNKSNFPMAFAVYVLRRTQNEDGGDVLEEDNDSFTVFPRQVIVAPNSKSLVKIKWNGNAIFKKNRNLEQAFRVRFDQYMIDALGTSIQKGSRPAGARVNIALRVDASLYMSPRRAHENVKLISRNGKTVVVQNVGTRRASISEIPILIDGKKLADLLADSGGVILPGSRRKFKIR
jgi:P pilus assembly chaperone PapD